MNAKTLAKRIAKQRGLSRSQRGSVLVMIVGVLAMIALIVLVYSTVGQADKRNAAATIKRNKIGDQAAQVGDYFAKVIADSTFNYTLASDTLGNQRAQRVTWDYPYTDPELRSSANPAGVAEDVGSVNPASPARRFRPTGQVNGPFNPNVAPGTVVYDPRNGTGKPWLSFDHGSWMLRQGEDDNIADIQRLSDDYRDLMHISNFAPSGNFVNLVMLRRDPARPGSGFTVPSGIGQGYFTNLLSQRDRNFNVANQRADGRPLNFNRPYDWTWAQRGMIGGADAAASALSRPNHPDAIVNQWMDADGDGNPDSRPFELVDVSDMNNPAMVLGLDPTYRWVFGAKAIDLSSRVNLNTALMSSRIDAAGPGGLDLFTAMPHFNTPLGMTPAEVNLAGLLSYDSAYAFHANSLSGPAGYMGPAATYSGIAAGNDPYTTVGAYNSNVAWQVGRTAFAAKLEATLLGKVPAAGRFFGVAELPNPGPTRLLPQNNPRRIPLASFQALYVAAQDNEGAGFLLSVDAGTGQQIGPSAYSQAFFDLSDLVELLTFNGANDPNTMSRAEMTLGGRYSVEPALDPLRANRPAEAEIIPRNPTPAQAQAARSMMFENTRRFLTTRSGARPLRSRSVSYATQQAELARIDDNLDVAPNINALLETVLATTPSARGYTNNAAGFASLRADQFMALNSIFDGYCRALMPMADAIDNSQNPPRTSWYYNDLNMPFTLRQYAYGHRLVPPQGGTADTAQAALVPLPACSLELSLRAAAHLTLNLIGSRDISTRPFVSVGPWSFPTDEIVAATVVLDNGTLGINAGGSNLQSEISALGSSASGATVFDARRSDGSINGVRLFPFAHRYTPGAQPVNVQDVTQLQRLWGASVAEAATMNRTPGPFVRGGLLHLDYGRYTTQGQLINPPSGSPVPSRLAMGYPTSDPEAQVTARALNMYAVRPQPFVTMAASYVMYVDTPASSGGDRDFFMDPNTRVYDPAFLPTIRGDIREDNKDFICQMVVIRLANPFDVPLNLSLESEDSGVQDPGSTFKYYIEFGGRHYKLANRVEGGNTQQIVLAPQSTRAFYILSQTPREIARRMSQVGDGTHTEQEVYDWIFHQTGINVKGHPDPATNEEFYALDPFDPRTGDIDRNFAAGDLTDLLSPRSSSGTVNLNDRTKWEDNRQIRLWRAFRDLTPGQPEADGVVNSLRNDILVDRMRDTKTADRPTLDVRLDTGENDIRGATGGREGDTSADNTGVAVVAWGFISRPHDSTPVDIGGLPSYCIEGKTTLRRANGYTTSRNVRDQVNDISPGGLVNSPNQTWFARGGGGSPGEARPGDKTLKEMLTRHNLPIKSAIKADAPRGGNGLQFKVGPTTGGVEVPYATRVLQHVQTIATRGQSTPLQPMRLVDLLMPLAVGATHDPLRVAKDADLATDRDYLAAELSDRDNPLHLDVQWTTLSEALAIAMDCDSPHDPRDPDYFAGNAAVGALEGGRLMLDRFVPFHDYNRGTRAGVFDASGVNTAMPDTSAGIPFALDVLNQFRATTYGSATTSINGIVNINTASVAVLRAIGPFHTSTPSVLDYLGVNVADHPFDLASSIDAYRDKGRTWAPPVGSGIAYPVDFRDHNVDANAGGWGQWSSTAREDSGRQHATGIVGLREQPGISSVGELLAVRLREGVPIQPGNSNITDERRRASSMDRLQRRGQPWLERRSSGVSGGANEPTELAGLPQTLATNVYFDPSEPLGLSVSKLSNTYDQKLALAGAAMNTVSVRSDLYAVWFVMNGYRPEDCNNLTAEDPLVPSVQKRYLMVVDRSNVTQLGQKPRILTFQELPMR